MLIAQQSWTYEPSGDVPEGREGSSGTLVFADVLRVERVADSATVTFDAAQIFVGAPAEREAEADGKGLQGGNYVRNAYEHHQSAKLAVGCPVVYAWAETARSGVWPDIPQDTLKGGRYYWLVVEEGEITSMVWVNTN